MIKLSKSINKRIFKKIQESTYSDNVKNLLKNLLIVELDNIESGKREYTEDYDRYIKIFLGEDEQ